MFARVAMYHGVTADGIDDLTVSIGGQIDADVDSPTAGLEGLEELMLFVDPASGRALGITGFESRGGHARRGRTLQWVVSMSQGGGVRTGVGLYGSRCVAIGADRAARNADERDGAAKRRGGARDTFDALVRGPG